ncbi:MAG: cation:proton antiporter [Euryarchaeota archaeon]|nr:cation:proton antiporter [Euryarchaeota archaeon]
MGAPELDLLITFAVVLIAAELGSLAFQAMRLPRVVGMLAAGVLIGPSVNPQAVQIGLNPESISDLAFLGGIFLMFSIGLTFDVRRFRTVGAGAFILAVFAGITSFLAGFAVAMAFGAPQDLALFIGLLLTPTSSVIAIRLAHDQRMLAMSGVDATIAAVVIDDVTSLFIATIVLAFVGLGDAATVSGVAFGLALLLLLGSLVVLLAIGALPRALTLFERFSGQHPTLPAISLAFLVSFLFTVIGLPPIFGAFWAGSIIASSRFGDRIQEFIRPVTEIFSAVFFTAIGMLLNPFALPALGALVASALVVGILAKLVGGFLGLRVLRVPVVPAMACATLMVPRGEVSLVIAQYAGDLAQVERLQLIASVLVVVTTLGAPILLHGVRFAARRSARERTARAEG